MFNEPIAYFITFTVYGSWLHGDDRGSYNKETEFVPPNPRWVRMETNGLEHPPYLLSAAQRELVAQAIREVCIFRGWLLHEQNVRTNHVHTIITAKNAGPEKVMRDLKARATRLLREAGLFPCDKVLWTEHGSTRYLFTEESLRAARHYVREQ